MPRRMDAIDHWSAQVGPPLRQQVDAIGDRLLLVVGEAAPLLHELIGDLDLPCHQSMTFHS